MSPLIVISLENISIKPRNWVFQWSLQRKSLNETSNETISYDANGNLDFLTARDGKVEDYDYDALNRLTQITFDNGWKQTYTYDFLSQMTSAKVYNATNDLLSSSTFTHKSLRFLDTSTQQIGTLPTQTLTYGYTGMGLKNKIIYGDNEIIDYTYTPSNLLDTIKISTVTPTLADYDYDPENLPETLLRGNGVDTSWTRKRGEVTGLLHQKGEQVIANYGYGVNGLVKVYHFRSCKVCHFRSCKVYHFSLQNLDC